MARKYLILSASVLFGMGTAASASETIQDEARRKADAFLGALDYGNVKEAYVLLKPEVRIRYDIAQLGQTNEQRRMRTKGAVKRSFVKFGTAASAFLARSKSPTAMRMRRSAGTTEIVVCYFEPPVNSFGTASYTAVTVSGRTGDLWVENFQTTSEPATACR